MDTTTLLILVIIVLVVLLVMSRRGGMTGGSPYGTGTTRRTGPERPTYDDPEYTSTGSIGGTEVRTPPVSHQRSVGETGGRTNDDPNYRSGGSIGGPS